MWLGTIHQWPDMIHQWRDKHFWCLLFTWMQVDILFLKAADYIPVVHRSKMITTRYAACVAVLLPNKSFLFATELMYQWLYNVAASCKLPWRKSPVFYTSPKHIKIQYYFIKESVLNTMRSNWTSWLLKKWHVCWGITFKKACAD